MFENYTECRQKAANIRAVFGAKYDRSEISRETFDRMIEYTADMKNNPHKYT
jgi:hypothetical protein